MSEDTGFAEPESDAEEPAETEPAPGTEADLEPAEDATPLPPVDADPQEVADQAAAAEPGPADHVPPPWLPDEGVPDAIRNAINELHRRLVNLGG